ncbi:DNA helicase IV, partial [Klebsiella pneumoniae]|nr:DNA helicase IV [Klebsiella pneumoniae]
LHGTEWAETQRFHYHLNTRWQQWSQEMSVIAAQVLQQVLDDIALSNTQEKWLPRQQPAGLQQKIAQALTALPLPVARLEEFDNCRDAWRKC